MKNKTKKYFEESKDGILVRSQYGYEAFLFFQD